MKVLLIRPPIYAHSLRYPGGPRFGVPLGLLCVAAALEREGLAVSVYDALAEFSPDSPVRNGDGTFHIGAVWEAIAARVQAEQPDVVGISNPFADFAHQALRASQETKRALPSVFTVVGGPHPSSSPDDFLTQDSGVDCVVRGEGERTVVELVRALASGSPLDNVAGVSWRGKDGVVRHNPMGPFVAELDELPLPAYHLVDMERYFGLAAAGFPSRYMFEYPGCEREVSLVTSRGCPFHCVFCGNHLHMGRTWRSHSSQYVLRHMGMLVSRYGVRHFHLEDDNITLDRKRFEDILDGIIAAKWGITWDTPNGVRAEGLTEDLLAKARRSGCTYLIIGIESGNQRVLDTVVKKRLNLQAVRETARLCNKVGLDLHGFYVVGFPGETRQDIHDTFAFALGLLKKHFVVPHLCMARPLPGTELQKICEDNGYLTEPLVPDAGQGLRGEVFSRRMIRTDQFSPQQLEQWVAAFNRSVIRALLLQIAFWLCWHPLAALRVGVGVVRGLRRGPVEAVKRVFYGGVMFRGNYVGKPVWLNAPGTTAQRCRPSR